MLTQHWLGGCHAPSLIFDPRMIIIDNMQEKLDLTQLLVCIELIWRSRKPIWTFAEVNMSRRKTKEHRCMAEP